MNYDLREKYDSMTMAERKAEAKLYREELKAAGITPDPKASLISLAEQYNALEAAKTKKDSPKSIDYVREQRQAKIRVKIIPKDPTLQALKATKYSLGNSVNRPKDYVVPLQGHAANSFFIEPMLYDHLKSLTYNTHPKEVHIVNGTPREITVHKKLPQYEIVILKQPETKEELLEILKEGKATQEIAY